uniref:Pecanex-like protein n=1 Tax=Heterorhabditis bacteriophora TaxID=37862 RepID=A0A1I7WTY8_HETBA
MIYLCSTFLIFVLGIHVSFDFIFLSSWVLLIKCDLLHFFPNIFLNRSYFCDRSSPISDHDTEISKLYCLRLLMQWITDFYMNYVRSHTPTDPSVQHYANHYEMSQVVQVAY